MRNNSEESIALWEKYISTLRIIPLRGRHFSIFNEENAESTRQVLENILEKIN